MKFNFPKKNNKENVQIKIRVDYIAKSRLLAEINDCTISDIYETLIEEGIEEYQEQFGEIGEKQGKKNYSTKRDLYEAGDERGLERYENNTNTESSKEEPIIIVGTPDDEGDEKRQSKEKKTKLTDEQKEYQREYYQKNKDKLVAKKREVYRPNASEDTKRNEAATKADYYYTHSEKIHQNEAKKTEKLPKDWYKKEKIEKEIAENDLQYCQWSKCEGINPFKKGTGVEYEDLIFCSEYCRDLFLGQEFEETSSLMGSGLIQSKKN